MFQAPRIVILLGYASLLLVVGQHTPVTRPTTTPEAAIADIAADPVETIDGRGLADIAPFKLVHTAVAPRSNKDVFARLLFADGYAAVAGSDGGVVAVFRLKEPPAFVTRDGSVCTLEENQRWARGWIDRAPWSELRQLEGMESFFQMLLDPRFSIDEEGGAVTFRSEGIEAKVTTGDGEEARDMARAWALLYQLDANERARRTDRPIFVTTHMRVAAELARRGILPKRFQMTFVAPDGAPQSVESTLEVQPLEASELQDLRAAIGPLVRDHE